MHEEKHRIRRALLLLANLVFGYLLRSAMRLEMTLGPIELLRVAWACRAEVFGLDFQLRAVGVSLAFHFTKASGMSKFFLVLAGLGAHSISIASTAMREIEAQQLAANEVAADIEAAFEAIQEEVTGQEEGLPPDLEYEEDVEG